MLVIKCKQLTSYFNRNSARFFRVPTDPTLSRVPQAPALIILLAKPVLKRFLRHFQSLVRRDKMYMAQSKHT